MTSDSATNQESGGLGQEPSNTTQLLPEKEKEVLTETGKDDNSEQARAEADPESVSAQSNGPCCSLRHFSKIASGVAPTLICPTMTRHHFIATRLEIFAILGALFYVVISFSWAEPIREPALQLVSLFVLAQIFGVLVKFVHLPPLLGMLLAGILLKQIDYFHAEGIFLKFTATVRSCAMTMILLRAGLGLNPLVLCRLSTVVLRVAVFPCSVEAVTVAVVSHYLLDLPWQWGFLLGFILSAVSPAVLVPSLLTLQSNGYGENKGIATLVIAASSLDNIYAITIFGIFLSAIFSQGSIMELVVQGPLEVLIGIIWGILIGVISIYIPHSDEKSVIKLRTIMVCASGLLAVLGSQLVGYAGAGPLGCIVGAFVAGCGWRAFSSTSTYEPVMLHLTEYWLLLQPFLFGLIGTEIDISSLGGNSLQVAGLSAAVITIGVVVRMLACCISVQGCGLNFQETLFVGLSWLPKATVQAAIGPVALDLARSIAFNQEQNIHLAEKVLMIAVLSVILTAPIGAIGILGAGPLLLTRSKTEESIIEKKSEDEDHPDAELQEVL